MPAYYPTVSAPGPTFDRAWNAALGAVNDTGVQVAFADPPTGRVTLARISAGEAAVRRAENERRHSELVRGKRALDMDPVVVSSHDHKDIVFAFLSWADQRLFTRGRA